MKKLVKYLLVLLFFASCTPQKYYQLVETDSDDLVKTRDSQTFENEDLIVSYNLWSNKGNGTFVISNKTDKDIFLDLKRSHLIINDFALTYFQNRVYSTPKVSFFSSSTDEELMEQRKIRFPGITPKRITDESIDVVIFNEERIICVPPQSSQIVYGFNLQSEIYRDCNLHKFPKQKEIISSEFTKESSPYIFRNRLTYSFSESMEGLKQIENEFWVTKVTNLPENQFVSFDYIKFCNDSSSNKMRTYPYSDQASYFIEYRLEPGRINH